MKFILYFLFFISIGLNAQSFSDLNESISKLDNALVKKDSATLDLILHKNVSITHSNGFTENKSEIKKNTASSFIKYNKIEQKPEPHYQKINGETYIIYRYVTVKGIYDIYDFEVNLRLMEVWIWEQNHWQLIGRQSLEIDENKF